MNDETLLHRQIHPMWRTATDIAVAAFTVTNEAFSPSTKDAGCLSVFNGDLTTAESAYHDYTAQGWQSCGVLSVSYSECASLSLSCRDDPTDIFPHHSIIDYIRKPPLTKGERRAKAKQLREYALNRGWQYQA